MSAVSTFLLFLFMTHDTVPRESWIFQRSITMTAKLLSRWVQEDRNIVAYSSRHEKTDRLQLPYVQLLFHVAYVTLKQKYRG